MSDDGQVEAGVCPFTVDRPVMRQRWERLTFLHWRYDTAQVQRLAVAAAVARTTYRLPYFWSRMRLAGRGSQVAYGCQRRWPGPRPVTSRVRIEVGDRLGPADLDERDHFLTARWMLFSAAGSHRRFARACHEPWPLHRARVIMTKDQLVAAAGLPPPQGEPLAHYSPGVDVAIGRPQADP